MAIWRTRDLTELLTTPPHIGQTKETSFEISDDMLTRHITNGPAVLSTPAMIGLMESVASAMLRPQLAPGAALVGTWIGVRHRAPALLGERIDVQARLARITGAHVTFDMVARVGERTIGDGEVTQTLVRVS